MAKDLSFGNDIIIGHPMWTDKALGSEFGFDNIKLKTNEKFLPRILVELGYFKSVSEVRKNRPDLVIDITAFGMVSEPFTFGKKLPVWIFVGFDTIEERNREIEQYIKDVREELGENADISHMVKI